MKRMLALVLSVAMMVSMFAACGNDTATDTSGDNSNTTNSNSSNTSDNSTDNSDTAEPDLSGEPDGVVPGTSASFYSTNSNTAASQLPGYGGSVNLMYMLIYDTLFWSPSGEYNDVDGLLVDTWSISDDNLVWTLNLHENATFNNGNPVNADAIVSAFDYYVVDGYDTVSFAKFDTYEATGEYQVTITMTEADPEFSFKMCNYNIGIFDTSLYKEMGRVVEAAYMAGSGPYYVSDYAIGDYVTLTAREDNWCEERQAHIETLTCKSITNGNTQYNALAAGEMDFGSVASFDSMEMLLSNPDGTIIEFPGVVFTTWFNADGMCEYLENDRVREALSMMIDQEELVVAATGGYGTVGQNAGNSHLTYVHNRTYDPDAALAILEEEGINPSDIQLTALCINSVSMLFSNLQSQFMDYGITLDFVIQEVPAANTAGMAGEWDLWAELGGLNSMAYYFKLANVLTTAGAQHVVHDTDITDTVNELTSEALGAMDYSVRDELLNEVLQVLDEHYAYLSNYSSVTWAYHNNRIENVNVDWWNNSWRSWESLIA